MEGKVKVPVVIRNTNVREKGRFLAGKRIIGNPIPELQGRSLPNVIIEEPIDFRRCRCPCDAEVPAFLPIQQRPDKRLRDEERKQNPQITFKHLEQRLRKSTTTCSENSSTRLIQVIDLAVHPKRHKKSARCLEPLVGFSLSLPDITPLLIISSF